MTRRPENDTVVLDTLQRELAWRTLGFAMLLTLGAALLTARLAAVLDGGVAAAGGWPAWMLTVPWAAAWLLMARFRLLTARRPRAWLVVLVLAAVGTLSGSEGLRIAGLVLGILFMLRRQGSLRLLGSRRRAFVFLLAGPLLALTFAGGFGSPVGAAGAGAADGGSSVAHVAGVARAVFVFSRTSVQVFWVTALLTLLIGMRLHFLRLRPKLLITGALVGVVPLLLLAVFGLVLLYGTLGGSRANRARDILQESAQIFAAGRIPDLWTAQRLVWDEQRPEQGPPWAGQLVAALRAKRLRDRENAGRTIRRQSTVQTHGGAVQVDFGDGDTAAALAAVTAATDTTAWVHTDKSYWLVNWRDSAPGQARVEAIVFDRAALARLARVLRADLQVRSMSGGATVSIEELDGLEVSLESRYEAGGTDPDGGFWRKPRFFGTTMLAVVNLTENGFGQGYIWLTLQTSFSDLAREFASQEAVGNMVILIALGLVAVLFVFAALTAFILSLRITGGITGAVKTLHWGTQRLAAGDLDAVIEIENEDEFGDLAQSFNTMTVAVKQGRQDAIARERLQQEMKTARQIQERLLPHQAPSLAGWEVTGVSLPSLQVGGDYFDFLQTESGRLGLAIGDVSGKGVPAALLMSNLQASLKGQVLNRMPVAEVVARINQLLATSTDAHMFATFIYGELDAATGTFVSANAGHEPPLLVRRDGSVDWLVGGGLLLGMFPDQSYEPVAVELEPGDVLVLYTDGITEAGAPNPALRSAPDDRGDTGDDLDDADDLEDDADSEFGEKRLADVVRDARQRSALAIREAILGAVQEHLAGDPPGDDITLVVVKRGERS